MPFGKKEDTCTLIGSTEDGSRKYVCQVDENKVFEVTTKPNGEIADIAPKTVLLTPKDYEKIHKALKNGISPV